MEKTSSARRIHHVLKMAVEWTDRPQGPSIQVWARIFGLVPKNFDGQLSPTIEYEAVQALADLRAEVENVERQVAGKEAEAATSPIADTVRNITATSQLHTDFQNVKANYLKPDLVAGWYWAALFLSDTDTEFDPEDIANLRAELEELEKAARDVEIPHELRMMIDKHVRHIRSALRRYDICGVEPLCDIANAVIGEAWKEQELLAAAAASKSPKVQAAYGHIKRVWGALVQISGDAEKLRKGIKAAGALAQALPFFKD